MTAQRDARCHAHDVGPASGVRPCVVERTSALARVEKSRGRLRNALMY